MLVFGYCLQKLGNLLVRGDVVGVRWLSLNPAIYSADFSHTWAGEKSRSPRAVVYVGCYYLPTPEGKKKNSPSTSLKWSCALRLKMPF